MIQRFRPRRNGQTTMEFMVLIILLIGALISIGVYFRRGLQGRWKAAVDDLGDQYDPQNMNTDISYGTTGSSEVRITTIDAPGGFWTMRTDQANMTETTDGFTRAGQF